MYDYLTGKWILNRKIIGSINASVQGNACFKNLTKNKLLYRENCNINLNNTKKINNSYSSYIYEIKNKKINVYFNDFIRKNKLFHSLNMEKTHGKVYHINATNHLCGKDLYKTKYIFYSINKFKIIYKVRGIKKNYISITNFEKQ